jgi:hypothetical protein
MRLLLRPSARLRRDLRLWATTGWVVVLASCAEPDPNYGPPGGIITQKLPNATGGGGGGGTSGAAAPDPFGAAYDANANKPTTTLRAGHTAAAAQGAPSADSTIPDCLSCHAAGLTAASKPWSFGGQVANKLANVDVVVTDGTNKIGPVKSDADGFFWATGNPVAAQMHVFVRNANGNAGMTTALLGPADGGCMQGNTCHGGSKGPLGTSLH